MNGRPTKTEMVDSSGGRNQIAQISTAAIVLLVLLFLTGPLAYLPNAVLASVVFLIGVRLMTSWACALSSDEPGGVRCGRNHSSGRGGRWR